MRRKLRDKANRGSDRLTRYWAYWGVFWFLVLFLSTLSDAFRDLMLAVGILGFLVGVPLAFASVAIYAKRFIASYFYGKVKTVERPNPPT